MAGIAPAIVKSEILMPVKKIVTPQDKDFWKFTPNDEETAAKLRALGISDNFLKSDPFPPAKEFKHKVIITESDLLDDKYADAVQQFMLEEDRKFQQELGRLMAEEIKAMSQRKGFLRRILNG